MNNQKVAKWLREAASMGRGNSQLFLERAAQVEAMTCDEWMPIETFSPPASWDIQNVLIKGFTNRSAGEPLIAVVEWYYGEWLCSHCSGSSRKKFENPTHYKYIHWEEKC